MDLDIIVQLFLGVLWLLGCLIFVTFLLEFREDRLAHPNYPSTTIPAKPASNQQAEESRSEKIVGEQAQILLEANADTRERSLYTSVGGGNGG